MPHLVKPVTPEIAALPMRPAWGTVDDAVASAPPQTPQTFAALLRDDLEQAKISVRELGKRVAEASGTEVESERRGLQRYLKGEVQPTPEKAQAIATVLGVDAERYARTATLQKSMQELLIEIAERLDELSEEIKRRDERVMGARARNRVVDRLVSLEERVAKEGEAMREGLSAIRELVDAQLNGRANGPQRQAQKPTRRRVSK